MKTENELIEDFWVSQGGKPHWKPELSLYESSWDLLMPVVDRINNLEDAGAFKGFDTDIIRSMHEWISLVKINNVYGDIVTIIHWYNSQNL